MLRQKIRDIYQDRETASVVTPPHFPKRMLLISIVGDPLPWYHGIMVVANNADSFTTGPRFEAAPAEGHGNLCAAWG